MGGMATTNHRSNNSLTLTLNSSSIIHRIIELPLSFLFLKLFFSMLTSTSVLNKVSQSSTLAFKLLVIVATLLNWDWNISDLVMGRSKVGICGGVVGLDDSPCVSLDIGLGLCVEF